MGNKRIMEVKWVKNLLRNNFINSSHLKIRDIMILKNMLEIKFHPDTLPVHLKNNLPQKDNMH